MSTKTNIWERFGNFSPSSVPLDPFLKLIEEHNNAVKALTFVDYLDYLRSASGDAAVLAAIPKYLTTDIAKRWYRLLLKEKGEDDITMGDVIWGILNTFSTSNANELWYKRYDQPNLMEGYLKSAEFAQRSAYIRYGERLEIENRELREQAEEIQQNKGLEAMTIHGSDKSSSQIGDITPASTVVGSPSQPHLRPLRVNYYVRNCLEHHLLIPFHDAIAYEDLGPLTQNALVFAQPVPEIHFGAKQWRFHQPGGGGLITPEVWPLVRAGLKLVHAVLI
ncbi:hypothetical protein RUND412_007408 [Rhizina undulata]